MSPSPQRQVRSSTHSVPPMALVAIVIAILGGGIVLAMLKKPEAAKSAQSAKQSSAADKPFSDLGPDRFAHKASTESATPAPFSAASPLDLEHNETWMKALALAEEGEALWQEVTDAKAENDRTTLNEKGRQAKDKFDAAFSSTALLEEQLLEKHGDSNPSVRQMVKTRSVWVKRLDWLLKNSGR